MLEPTPVTQSQLARRLRRGFYFALAAIAIVCTANTALMLYQLQQRRQDAPVLRMAVQQRTVAHEIARSAMEVRFLRTKTSARSLQELSLELRAEHDRLKSECQRLSRTQADSPALEKLKNANEDLVLLANLTGQLLNRWNQLESQDYPKQGPEDPELRRGSLRIWSASEEYSQEIDTVANEIQAQLRERGDELTMIQFALLGLTLAALAAMAIFLFRPLGLMVERAFRAARKSREHAEAQAQERAEFLAKASHEFRTPLNAIIGFERLALATDLSPEQEDYLSSSHRSAEHLLELVNGILDYSKYESGRFVMDPTPFAVKEVVAAVMELNALDARRRGIELRSECANNIPETVLGDPLFMKQVLINLVRNAIKFTRDGEVVICVHRSEGDKLRLAVRDTGMGIQESDKERIFDAFRQANNTTARPFEGTGLGLTISRQLIQRMGGDLELESTPGKGSTFSFELSLPEVTSRVWSEHVPERPFILRPKSRSTTEKRRVLLAEDNAVNARLTRMQLEELGFECLHVTDGQQAIDALPTGNFDMVLMDLHMPGCDGFEATRRIRDEDQKGCDVPIVALTADLSVDSRSRAFEAGVDDYVTKPVRTEDLERVIESWVELGGQTA